MTGRQREICLEALSYFDLKDTQYEIKLNGGPEEGSLYRSDTFTLSIQECEVAALISMLTRERASVHGGRDPDTERQDGQAVLTLTNEGLAAQGFLQDQITDEMFTEIRRELTKHFELTWNGMLWTVAKEVFARHGKEGPA